MHRVFWSFSVLLGAGAFAQEPCAFSLGADTTVCVGANLTVSAPADLDSYTWSTGATSPGITVVQAGTYWVSITQAAAIGLELITNGDFDNGTAGFTSDYEVPTVPGPYGLLSDEGQYAVTTDPNLAHIDFNSCGDHTTGTGGMMVVNGAATPNEHVWCQDVVVQPHTTYTFSAWLMTTFPANPSTLAFSINGLSFGDPLAAPADPCTWQQFATSWDSGDTTSATVCIVNQNTEIFGNDFALDDISFTGGSAACAFTDTIVVAVADPALQLGPDVLLCPGADTVLTADPALAGVQWNTGTGGPAIVVDAPGTYWAQRTVGGCTAADTVVVVPAPALPAAPPTATVVLCPGTPVHLAAPLGEGITYQWSTGAEGAATEVSTVGTYTVTLTGACGQRTDTVVVAPADCGTDLYLPNAVTPNGDGINDGFGPVFAGSVRPFVLDIYDRWGELIHHTTDPAERWNATYKGQAVPIGVYVWKLHYYEADPGSERTERDRFGHVTVVR